MATYFARKAGNVNAADVWATMPNGTASNFFPTFTSADVLVSNSFTVTLNVNTTVAEVRNDATGGATVGGGFTLSDGVTLTANMVQGQVTGSVTLVSYGGSSPNSASIVGNASSVATTSHAYVIQFTGSGTLNLTGNLTGDASSGINTTNAALIVSGSGVLNFTGNTTGGSGSNAAGAGIHSSSTATININGNCFGGTGTAPGVRNAGAATININGIAAGSPATGTGNGVVNASTGIVNLKRARGNAYGPGNSSGIAAAVGAANSGLGVIQIEELEFGTNGMSPVSGTGIRLKKLGTNVAVFNYCDTAGAKTLIDATANAAMPAATDVRNGVSYAGGAATGTLAVPLPSQVAVGVATDNTVGTAFVTGSDIATAVWGAATRSITGGTVDTLTNAPDVPTEGEIASAVWSAASREITGGTVDTLTNAPASVTPSDIWSHATRTITGGTVDTLTNAPTVPSAAAIRAEIDSNSTQLAAIKAKTDNLPASPAATGDIPSANISAIKAKTDLLETTRLAQCSTVATTGAQLAAALS